MQLDLNRASLQQQMDLNRASLQQQSEFKANDLRQYFLKRYDELASDAKFKVTNRGEAKIYYRRFWNLNLEEYQYWCDGMIDQRIYEGWMDSRKLEWESNEEGKDLNDGWSGPDYTYRQAWGDISGFLKDHDHDGRRHYTEFVDFMNDIFYKKATQISRDRCGSNPRKA